MALVKSTQHKKLAPNVLGSMADPLPAEPLPADPLKCLLCEYYGFSKVTAVQETCPICFGSTYQDLESSKPQEVLLCEYYGFNKVNSEQETCPKYFVVVHIIKFQIKQTTRIYPTRISWL